MEFVIGATAACGACVLTNPMDVVKTRMQLQGELKSRGQYSVVYKNVLTGAYAIAKADGLKGLQKGLVASLWYQVVVNGIRFELYMKVMKSGIISNSDGSLSSLGCIAAASGSGVIGGLIGNPFYLVKIHLQSKADKRIAVGHQHSHRGVWSGLFNIARTEGITGVWRGASTAVPRIAIGCGAQLFSYFKTKEWLSRLKIFPEDSWQSTLISAIVTGFAVMVCVSPFDVASTRIYNQGLDNQGRGLLYTSMTDCLLKTWKAEGIRGLYKGCSAVYFRLGPYSFFNMIIWDYLQSLYKNI